VVKISTKKETSVPSAEVSYHERRALDRLIFFSDGVFAIAITLLVLNVVLPVTQSGSLSTDLSAALLATVPRLFAYALSFLVIGAYWMAHQRTFHYIERFDRRLAGINLFFLLFVALVPFPTGVLSAYGDQLVAAVLYAATQAIIGILLSVLWLYASHNHRLVAKKLTAKLIRDNTFRNAFPPLIFLASIGIAFVSILAAEAMWVLTFAVNAVLVPRIIETV
jgi:TMEM175 potassium channel family protein